MVAALYHKGQIDKKNSKGSFRAKCVESVVKDEQNSAETFYRKTVSAQSQESLYTYPSGTINKASEIRVLKNFESKEGSDMQISNLPSLKGLNTNQTTSQTSNFYKK